MGRGRKKARAKGGGSFAELGPQYKAKQVLGPQYAAWGDQMTQDQLEALYDYTGGGYQWMNEGLREGGGYFASDDQEKAVYDLLDALEAAPALKQNIMLHRLFGHEELWAEAKAGEIKTGDYLYDSGFMSTGTAPVTAFEGYANVNAIEYRIKAPKGTKGGAWVDNLSSNPGESEFLFGPDTPLRVDKVTMVGGVAVFDVTVDQQ